MERLSLSSPAAFATGPTFGHFVIGSYLGQVAIRHVHVFESRKKAFSDDDVLQENIIVRFEKAAKQEAVTVSTSHDATFTDYIEREVPFDQVVKPDDAEKFIHIPTLELNGNSHLFAHTLNELGLDVATGQWSTFASGSIGSNGPRPSPHRSFTHTTLQRENLSGLLSTRSRMP